METKLFAVFGVISILICVLFLGNSVFLYRSGKRAKRVLSSIQLFTIGVFFSVVSIFIPIYYTGYDFGDSYSYVRPLLLAVHNSLRVFIVDGEFDIIVNALRGKNELFRICFSLYVAVLYIVAPALTFTNVLSLFKNIKGEARFWLHRRRKHYIMSELNAKSLALAKSIYAVDKNAIIVFADVFERNREEEFELLTEAADLNAICLKRDIAYLDIFSKKGDVEMFLIGDNESENISQAVKITNEINCRNKKHNVKVFVFSSNSGASYIIDSIPYDNLLKYAEDGNYENNYFKLRRIDEKRQLIWHELPKMKLFDVAAKHDKTLSVLIAGFGSYGIEFFKAILWYCQFEGYKLRITIVDKKRKRKDGTCGVQSAIERFAPELLEKNRTDALGEAYYDIEIIPGIDVETSDFEKLLFYNGNDLEKQKLSERLKDTNVAFVSLGDDDVNIEVSVYFRSLFDRVNNVIARKDIRAEDEAVAIYSVVYDDHKSGILQGETQQSELFNYKDIPYHVKFIGGLSSQFDYSNIYNSNIEETAYATHVSWVEIEERIHTELLERGVEVDAGWFSYANEQTPVGVMKNKKKFAKYEYYRLSSIAKAMYKNEVEGNAALYDLTKCLKNGEQSCECENCVRRKRSEHMRWNAYMRVNGFSYNADGKNDRAMLHGNLCEWDLMPPLDKLKD